MSASTAPAARRGTVVQRTVAAGGLIFALVGCSGDTDAAPAPSSSASVSPDSSAETAPGPTTTPEPTDAPVAVNPERPDTPGAYPDETLAEWARSYDRMPRQAERMLAERPKVPMNACAALDTKQPSWSAVQTDPDQGTAYGLFGTQDDRKQSYRCSEDETLVVKVDLNTGEVLQGPKVFAQIQRRAQKLTE